jgi:hypothetical protein
MPLGCCGTSDTSLNVQMAPLQIDVSLSGSGDDLPDDAIEHVRDLRVDHLAAHVLVLSHGNLSMP